MIGEITDNEAQVEKYEQDKILADREMEATAQTNASEDGYDGGSADSEFEEDQTFPKRAVVVISREERFLADCFSFQSHSPLQINKEDQDSDESVVCLLENEQKAEVHKGIQISSIVSTENHEKAAGASGCLQGHSAKSKGMDYINMKSMSVVIVKGAIYPIVFGKPTFFEGTGHGGKSLKIKTQDIPLISIKDKLVDIKQNIPPVEDGINPKARKRCPSPGLVQNDKRRKRSNISDTFNNIDKKVNKITAIPAPKEAGALTTMISEEFKYFCLDCEDCMQYKCEHLHHSRFLVRDLHKHFQSTGHGRAQPINNFLKTENICRVADLVYCQSDPGIMARDLLSKDSYAKKGNKGRETSTNIKCRREHCNFAFKNVIKLFQHIKKKHSSAT